MSANESGTAAPQSMRQRRILDVAEEHPTASVAELASMVSSATPELVEQVLDSHGDPSASNGTSAESAVNSPAASVQPTSDDRTETGDQTETDDTSEPDASTETPSEIDTEPQSADDSFPTVDDLSKKQRDVLEVVAARPEATQREIASHFDLSTTTIHNRVTSIPGFEWADRESFVETIFDDPPSVELSIGEATETASDTSQTKTATEPTARKGVAEAVSDLETGIEQLSDRLVALETTVSNDESIIQDPELVHKIVHACLDAENITESEELRILKAVLQ